MSKSTMEWNPFDAFVENEKQKRAHALVQEIEAVAVTDNPFEEYRQFCSEHPQIEEYRHFCSEHPKAKAEPNCVPIDELTVAVFAATWAERAERANGRR